MKTAAKKPKVIKSAVFKRQDRYALYYADPIFLGEIQKLGKYWYTADNQRHVSSTDAIDYLVNIREMTLARGSKYIPQIAPEPKVEAVKQKISRAKIDTNKKIQKKVVGSGREETITLPADIAKQFMEFMNTKKSPQSKSKGK